MDTPIFKFKKSFHFSSESFYSDVIFIIVNLLNFLINSLEATLFLSQYGISIKINGGLTSKRPGGMIKSMYL